MSDAQPRLRMFAGPNGSGMRVETQQMPPQGTGLDGAA
jgi:hypothetical protein